MKLQISFDTNDLEKALSVAQRIVDYADIFEIGTILIHRYGIKALEEFRQQFPQKTLLVDAKIIDRGKETATLFAQAGANWITVMAGTSKDVIHGACTAAQAFKANIMLDLLDSCSLGQSALEAKNLGADALLFHQPHDEQESLIFLDKWDMIKENTTLPIFVSAKIKRETIQELLYIKPAGLIIGKSIIEAQDPVDEAKFFHEICAKN